MDMTRGRLWTNAYRLPDNTYIHEQRLAQAKAKTLINLERSGQIISRQRNWTVKLDGSTCFKLQAQAKFAVVCVVGVGAKVAVVSVQRLSFCYSLLLLRVCLFQSASALAYLAVSCTSVLPTLTGELKCQGDG